MAGGDNTISNLFIVDDEYLETPATFCSVAEESEKQLDEFLRTMMNLQYDMVVMGNSANLLVQFCTQASAALKGKLNLMVEGYTSCMQSYIGEIDTADSVLFGEG